ncbi:MAG: hypothetical protein ABIT38_02710 [Gemmatimonadaceae bacterium]
MRARWVGKAAGREALGWKESDITTPASRTVWVVVRVPGDTVTMRAEALSLNGRALHEGPSAPTLPNAVSRNWIGAGPMSIRPEPRGWSTIRCYKPTWALRRNPPRAYRQRPA